MTAKQLSNGVGTWRAPGQRLQDMYRIEQRKAYLASSSHGYRVYDVKFEGESASCVHTTARAKDNDQLQAILSEPKVRYVAPRVAITCAFGMSLSIFRPKIKPAS